MVDRDDRRAVFPRSIALLADVAKIPPQRIVNSDACRRLIDDVDSPIGPDSHAGRIDEDRGGYRGYGCKVEFAWFLGCGDATKARHSQRYPPSDRSANLPGSAQLSPSSPTSQCITFSRNCTFCPALGAFIPIGRRCAPETWAENIAASPNIATLPLP